MESPGPLGPLVTTAARPYASPVFGVVVGLVVCALLGAALVVLMWDEWRS